MATELNNVEATLSIDSKKCYFVYLKLHQRFNAHHVFEAQVDYEELETLWMESAALVVKLIGKEVNIEMKHRDGSGINLFKGIVTNIGIVGKHGQQNYIVITGSSPTIKLAGKPAMDSFTDETLSNIITEAVSNSGNGAEVIVDPKFKSKIDYVQQNSESCFDFLNRMSWEYGEWFFYSGLEIFFGKKEGDSETIEYDKEMTYFDLSANLSPSTFNHYHYLNHEDRGINENDPTTRLLSGVRGYMEVSADRSNEIYQSQVTTPLQSVVNTKKDLNDLVETEKSRAVGETLVMRGKTQTSKVKIGSKITVKLPKTMKTTKKEVDTFLITEVTHEIDQAGYYTNSFEGVMSGLKAIPMKEPAIPVAHPQIAKVTDNEDTRERGLIKVQFQWQKEKDKTTNWIRVQTVDAGSSPAVPQNRGHVYLPEIDDIVMVGFEYGDPSRPFVMGSIFSEKISVGGGKGNHIKTITDKSGGQLLMNTDEGGAWGITIHDRNGNVVQLDTKGKNILITAPETIQLTANNIIMSAATNITSSAGEDITSTAGKNVSTSAGSDMMDIVRNNYKMMANNITELAKENYQSDADNIKQVAVKDIVIQSTGGKVVKNAKTRIDNNSGEKSTFH